MRDHGPIKLLDTEEMALYRLLSEHVQQLRANRATLDMKDLDLAAKSYQDALNDLVSRDSPPSSVSRVLRPSKSLLRSPQSRFC